MDVRLPDGTIIRGVPDGMSKADLTARLKANGYDMAKLEGSQPAAPEPSNGGFAETMRAGLRTVAPVLSTVLENPQEALRGAGNVAAGAVRGAGSIGATLLRPFESGPENQARRTAMDVGLQSLGADPESLPYQGGKLGAEIAGTAGVGGGLANVAARVPGVAAAAPNLLNAIRTSGMTAGPTGSVGNALLRAAGGSVTGGASAGLVDPESAKAGALIGGAAPAVVQGLGAAGRKVGEVAGKALRSGVSDEVAALAKRAKDLGVDIPADRLVNSRPLNALAAGLNYVPFSGRAATEDLMNSQLNRALSRTFGQDSSNVTQALRKASDDLGGKFDATLKSTGVSFDKQLLDELAAVHNRAEAELGSDALKPITSQINELITKGESGVIDGQAAYNIKRELDRIGRQKTPTAFHALQLKHTLMDALNRSLGPEGAQAFAQTRQQYSNMLALEKLAKSGVEGEISAARLANLQNINNEPLQELADIAAQFVKPREGQHGAAQRAMVGAGTAYLGGLPGLAAGAATGRAANTLLNSNRLRNAMLGEPKAPNKILELLNSPEGRSLQQALYRTAPVTSAR